MDAHPILVSACLLGAPCRYDGGSRPCPELMELLRGRPVLAVCPEMLAGFGAPRPAMELTKKGRKRALVDTRGIDITRRVDRSCVRILGWAKEAGVNLAVCKERSPSCGRNEVTQDGVRSPGQGWLVRKLLRSGVKVLSDEQIEELKTVLE